MSENLIKKIEELKKTAHNAVILVHNYQKQEVRDIADFQEILLNSAEKRHRQTLML
jgi:quinolinate synthase